VYRHADQYQADKSRHAADDFWVGGAEQPAEILAAKVAEHAQRFQADNPAGVQADGQIQLTGSHERVAEHDADQKQAEYSRENWQRVEKRREGFKQVAKSRQRLDAVEKIRLARFDEVEQRIE